MRVGVLEAKNHLSELVERAFQGEDVVITKRGEPRVRLIPATEAAPVVSRRQVIAELRARDAADPKVEGERLSWEQVKALRDEGRR